MQKASDNHPILTSLKLFIVFYCFIVMSCGSSAPKHKITRIAIKTSSCFGRCPVFELAVDSQRNAVFKAQLFNSVNGTFYGVIPPKSYDSLLMLVNRSGFDTAKEHYQVDRTDNQTAILSIEYDRGKTKTIEDYGMRGTPGLDSLFRFMFRLRDQVQWDSAQQGPSH